MKQEVIQTSFSGGEFGPSLYGRTDVAQYQNACEIVQNFLIRPYGPAITTPGTKYVATVSDSTLRTRLISFTFNRTDSYIIEMGGGYMRFYTNRGQISTTTISEDLSAYGANLKAQWKLNDNAATTAVVDTTAAHSGTSSTNTSTLHATGHVGTGCFDLGGANYVTVWDHDDFTRTASSTPMSMAAWVYFTSNGNYQYIFSKWDPSHFEWLMYVNLSNQLAVDLYDEDVNAIARWTVNSALTTGWHHVCFTFTGPGTSSSDGALYVDGVSAASTYANVGGFTKMVAGASNVGIGAGHVTSTPAYHWADKIDEVSFFHIRLDSSQVAALYGSGTTAYQISTVFSEAEIFDVKFTQLNDVIWLTHPNHPPQQLTRTSASEWAIADFAFLGGPFLDTNTNTATTITASATTGTVNLTVSPTNSNLFTVSAGTLGHQDSYWMIGGLAQTNATTGLQEYGYVQITYVTNSYTATATVIKNLKVSTATNVWAEGAWSSVRGYPGCVAFHDSRLWFGRTDQEPQKIWGSKIFEFDNFALDTEADDDALNLALASNESNEIQWLVSGKNLIAGTYGGAFVVNSGGSDVITPDNVRATEEVGIGASSIQPKKVGYFIYYLQRFKKKLRELFYVWDFDTFKAMDRTILSPHILGDGVVDMDAQKNPDTILYCVLTNGTLATFTREADQEVAAWSKQVTDGTYTTIAVIPSQSKDYDEAWVIVERWINGSQKKYVEYFEDISVPALQQNCMYLHSALSYSAFDSTSTSSCTISLAATGGSITVTVSTSYFVAGDANKRIRAIDDTGAKLGEGVITAYTSGTSVTVSVTTVFSALSYNAGRWGKSVASVSGLSHLNAKTVGILADGETESLTRTVASGVVTLGSNYFIIHVGLSYDQIIYTLRKDAASQRGTAHGKLQRINEISFKVNRSYLGFQYGDTAAQLDTLTDVQTTLTQSLTTTVIGDIPFRGGYPRGAQIYIKNSKPLPIELLSIAASLDTEDK